MADSLRLSAPVSSAPLAQLALASEPESSSAARPILVDGVAAPRPETPASTPSLQLADASAPGIRLAKLSSGAKVQTTQATPRLAAQVSLINISADEAAVAVRECLRAVSQLKGQSSIADRQKYDPAQVYRDPLGQTHVRMNRLVDGVPVFGEQVVAHMDGQGQVAAITGEATASFPRISTKPKVTPEQASAKATEAFAATPQEASTPELTIVKADDNAYHLAYRVVLTRVDEGQEPRKENYFVDAHSGAILFSFNEIHGIVPDWRQPAPGTVAQSTLSRSVASTAVPVGFGNSLYLGAVPLTTTRQGSGYVLRDPSHNNAETRDMNNKAPTDGLLGDAFSKARALTDNDNRWGAAGDNQRARAGIDAQYAATKYLDYLKDMFGRDGINGRGLRSLSLVHVNNNYVNAYWDGKRMSYGDGDGVTAGPLVDKDVASHEPTHGVTQTTSALVYRNESGALNEAMSDIIGSAGFSWWLRGKKDNGIRSDFLIGEDCWTPGTSGDALRYMDHPTRDRSGSSESYSRDNYASRYTGSSDNGGVHLNSGIANNAFYLLANGGTNDTSHVTVNDGIGLEKALRIFARANMVYFTPNTTFAQARAFTQTAARDLYGSGPEVERVGQAWSAVGVEAATTARELVGD